MYLLALLLLGALGALSGSGAEAFVVATRGARSLGGGWLTAGGVRASPLVLRAGVVDTEDSLEPLDADAEAEITLVHSSGREIDALLDAFVSVGGKRFAIAVPRDEPALIATSLPEDASDEAGYDEEDMEVVDVEDDDAGALVDACSAALADILKPVDDSKPVKLRHSAFVFTIENAEFTAFDDMDDTVDEDDDGEAYEVDMITSFQGGEKEYFVYRILEPVIMVAQEKPREDGKYDLLSDEEHDKIIPDIWDILANSDEYDFIDEGEL